MTDQSNTPQPPEDRPPESGPRKAGPSLIERAAGTFDFRQHLRAPVLPPVPPAPAAPVTAPPATAAPMAEPVQPEVPAPEAAEPAPEAAEPAPAAPFAPEGAQVFVPASADAVPADPGTPAPFANPALEGIPSRQRFKKAPQPIDRRLLREQCLIEPEGQVSALLEEFRIVKRQLLLQAADSRAGRTARHGERILVCSAHPGEGKTFCAVNLALSIAAEKDNEVLLVDADFAKPSVLSTLGLPGGPGLMDALADPEVMVEECIIPTDIPGLSVLPAGNQTGSDTEYLASVRTRAILDRLTAQSPNRIVIFDSPPALAASPASELAMHVGQAVMVVRADVTGEAALRDAVGILSGCADIKLLLNGTRFSPTGRRFGTYYGYKE
ncbi:MULTISPECIES: AAA family ATPase [unclassified Novosphingobium]|uniref:AAA family ATPase n=1 Tax=unclassified Novosphingobium TaxID=2644732 RepID=UPI001493E915|nr:MULTISPECIES: AAA family ATPase [unclassified Novosphingobium]MBB3358582.1 exopolysaccharide/PEP-CTERM locus tyrosine autokinase [Novosphingobium sp. BK256]MBB3374943.1 exopolysaccharide/PEP-CTERM locus tyrosine autokinase [Novosphingobium sp. BK280]MBB3379369.1 exopolysaccharide/PEP-CTERM locus tyrosine autokinase [Novosphingobium sp. BK258]MBB3421063.1 exopolysaccharide/PEP-CTERM locus tyrosine autokinase [Novosphingobium sp. BK267]MBB3449364.1 exopolysaccharide/PEP-CTERM locus tyrosine a